MKFNETVPKKWLSPSDDTVTIESPISPADWVIFNSGASSLYVVNYDEETWNVIIDFLNQPYCKRIPPLNRVLLIDNAARLAWIGRLSYRIFFDMLKYLERERKIDPQYNVAQEISFDPPYAALRALDDLNTLLRRTPIHGRFTNYVKKILKGMFRQTARSSFRVSARNGKQSRKQDRRSEVRDVGFL